MSEDTYWLAGYMLDIAVPSFRALNCALTKLIYFPGTISGAELMCCVPHFDSVEVFFRWFHDLASHVVAMLAKSKLTGLALLELKHHFAKLKAEIDMMTTLHTQFLMDRVLDTTGMDKEMAKLIAELSILLYS